MKRPFLPCRRPGYPVVAAMCAALLAAGPAKAQSGSPPAKKPKDQETLKKEGEKLFRQGKDKPESRSPGEASWSVVIEGFRGESQDELARAGLEKVRTQGGLADAYLEKRGAATVIAFGKFADSESKEARAALRKVRETEVVIAGGRTKPFATAFLAPPADIPGSTPEYDLRQARKRHGEWAIYTLQMGVYTRRDKAPTPAELAEFRKMAELAVTALRREGEQAFYHHGPTGSQVTVGLFGQEDYDPQAPGAESPALTALRKRYPYNLLNGQGMRESVTVNNQQGKQVKSTRMQPSSLVAVPKSD